LHIHVNVDLSYAVQQRSDMLLQVEVAALPCQVLHEAELTLLPRQPLTRIAAEEGIGNRLWFNAAQSFDCRYQTSVSATRPAVALEGLTQVPLAELDGTVVKYLMPSRYCHPDDFKPLLQERFTGLTGGALVAAMRSWVSEEFNYDLTASNARTTATDTLLSRKGVCRDYAHVMIALAQSAAIPARMASVYSPDVSRRTFMPLRKSISAAHGRWSMRRVWQRPKPWRLSALGAMRRTFRF